MPSLEQIEAIVESYVAPRYMHLIPEIAGKIAVATAIENDQRFGREWHAEQRLAANLESAKDSMGPDFDTVSEVARLFYAFARCPKISRDPTTHLHTTKGVSATIGLVEQNGDWSQGRALTHDIKALPQQPAIARGFTVVNDYRRWSDVIRRYRILPTSLGNVQLVRLTRDISYADLEDKSTGEVYELRRRSLFVTEPRILTPERRVELESIVGRIFTAGNVANQPAKLRTEVDELGYNIVEANVVAYKLKTTGYPFTIFPISTQFIALLRD